MRGKYIESGDGKTKSSQSKAYSAVPTIPTPSSQTSPSRRVSEVSGSVLNQSSGKKLTRISGATESSSHSIDQEELAQFAVHLNGISQRDKDLRVSGWFVVIQAHQRFCTGNY